MALGPIFDRCASNRADVGATAMVAKVAAALWVSNFASSLIGGGTEGITSRALQQGGLGMILTLLIVTTPPMAASFFNGVMGQFTGYNALAGGVPPGARGPGSPPVPGQQTVNQSNPGQAGRNDFGREPANTMDPRVALGALQRTPDSSVPAAPGGAVQGAWRETQASNPAAAASPLPVQSTTGSPTFVGPMQATPPPRGTGPQS